MSKIKQMVTGDVPTFINGALVPPNTPVLVNTDEIDLDPKIYGEDDQPIKGKTKDVGLYELGERAAPIPVVMGAINPTGPNPTQPQQIAPGDMQTPGGYATAEGAVIVAEGSAAALEVEEGGEPATGRAKRKTSNPLS